MQFKVIPNISVGIINFGEDRQKVRDVLGLDYTEFKKTKFSKNTTDNYGDFHVFYDEDNKCEAVEFFGGVELSIDEIKIFPSTVEILIKTVEGFKQDNYGYLNTQKSIGITNNENQIESILIGKRNYYK